MPTPTKYPELRDTLWVYKQLLIKSQKQLAAEIGCPHSCVRWVVQQKFTDEQRSNIKWDRKPHKNKVKIKVEE